MKDTMKTLTIRLPLRLLEQMREVALQNNRSLNGEVLTAMEEHVKKQRKSKA
jgi:predicted HicB family RNase H-like nuclease